MSCACCYKIILAECPDAITLQAGLQANTLYYYVITDKFGNQYGKQVESDGDGYITIDADDFPKGYFMNFSGQFELKIYPDEAAVLEEGTEIDLTLCEQTYSCVIIEFSEDDETYGSVIPDCDQAQTPIADDEIPFPSSKTFCDAVDDCMKVPTANGSYVLKILNGVKSWIAATAGATWGSITGTLSAQTDLQNALNAKENNITAGTNSQYWRGDKSWQTLDKSAVGLGNVDNTSDANKPVSTAQAAADTLVLNTAKAYSDTLVVGLIDDRGNYDASGNVFPSTGGSGAGGAILKGDLWTVSVAGTLGGNAVTPGDLVRALVDTPGQTASNWAVTENNIGYVAENQSNKTDVMSGNTTSSVKYLSTKGVYDWVIGLGYQVALTAQNFGTFINGLTAKTTPVDADGVALMDSADTNKAKFLSWANLKAALPLGISNDTGNDLELGSDGKAYFRHVLYTYVTDITVTGKINETMIHQIPIPTDIGDCIIRITSFMECTAFAGGAISNRVRLGTVNNPVDGAGAGGIGAQNNLGQNAVGSANTFNVQRSYFIKGGASGSIRYLSTGTNAALDITIAATTSSLAVDWTTQRYMYISSNANNTGATVVSRGVLVEILK